MVEPEELVEGLGQPWDPESSPWASPGHGQQAVAQVVLVHEGLICEGWGPDLAFSPHQPCGMRWGLGMPSSYSAPLPSTKLRMLCVGVCVGN